jgi:hypothetical protein
MTLREWVAETIVASYSSYDERQDVWQGALRYLDWLDSLIVSAKPLS